jgi:hypothetical protein
MNGRRIAVGATVLTVAVLAVVLRVLHWDTASKVVAVVSALSAVAVVGVTVWGALPGRSAESTNHVAVRKTGRAKAGPGGQANTGLRAPAGSLPDEVVVESTGDADASGGDANTGIRLE